VHAEPVSIAHGDARCLVAAVLEREQADEGKLRCLFAARR
jgi:hypothetical protein